MATIDDLKRDYYAAQLGVTTMGKTINDLEYEYFSNPPAGGPGGGAVDSVNGEVGVVVLDKTDVGLGNVNDTSDLNKPVSNATTVALATKAPLASPTFTGTVTLPGAPTNNLHAATKAYADGLITGLATTASLSALVADTDINAANGVVGTDANGRSTIATWPTGVPFDYICPGGVQPPRASVTSRTDFVIVWWMPTEPLKTGGYALPSDGWVEYSG